MKAEPSGEKPKARAGGFGGQAILETQVMLLAALVSEAWFGATELDAFMAESRKLADLQQGAA